MAKKIKKTKYKKEFKSNNEKRKTIIKDESEKKALEILKRNLLDKSDGLIKKQRNKKLKKIKNKKKEKEEEKDKKQKILSQNIIIRKSKKPEDNPINEINQNNGADLSLKKNMPQSRMSLESKKKENSPTLLQMIKNKQNLEEVQLIDAVKNGIKLENNQKKKEIHKKDLLDKQITKKNDETDKNEYIKRLKSKIVMVNGKMTIEKPDVGLINKTYKEEHNQDLTPKETIFISNEENVNSLSFLKIIHTKKWTEEETEKFYNAIKLFGLDFSFLEIVLHPRKRIEIKRKYLKEKKKSPKKIEDAINARKNVDKLNEILDLYKKQNKEKNQSNLGLNREESFRKRNGGLKEEKIDFNKEYNKILKE